MADNVGNGDCATASYLRVNPSHYFAHHHREIKRARVLSEDLDSISSLPNDILHVILSLLPKKFAIRTSVLSKRWRHVWSGTNSVSFPDSCCPDPDTIDKTLARYTARKMTSFHLCLSSFLNNHRPYVNSWIEFAISRNVENLWLENVVFEIPDFFYKYSSVKQLYVNSYYELDPKCSVSWTALKILTLHSFDLYEESFARILSGSPNLETLSLFACNELHVLDLSKSPRLKTLEIEGEFWLLGLKIVAPHIHSLRLVLTISRSCTLVDVSSLTEVELDIDTRSPSFQYLNDDFLQTIVLKMLEKLSLLFVETFLRYVFALSLAELLGLPFKKFKAKELTLKTTIYRSVIPGIVRVLQNSPELKKLTLRTMDRDATQVEENLDYDLFSYHFSDPYHCPEAEVFGKIYTRSVESKHVALFMELVLKTTKTLEKMVVRLGPYRFIRGFKELLQMVRVLSHDNNVSIVLSSTISRIREMEQLTSNPIFNTTSLTN